MTTVVALWPLGFLTSLLLTSLWLWVFRPVDHRLDVDELDTHFRSVPNSKDF